MEQRENIGYPRQILTQGEVTPELLERLQCYRVVSPTKRSREDTEVEKCFDSFEQYRTLYQRPHEGQIFKFPRHFRELENNNIKHYLPSPKFTIGSRGQSIDNTDWLPLDRTKSRSPPVSTSTSPNHFNSAVIYSNSSMKQKNEQSRKDNKTDGDDIVRCVPKKSAMEDEPEVLQYSTENTPIKQRNNTPLPITPHSLDKRFKEKVSDAIFSDSITSDSGTRRCSADFDSVDSPLSCDRQDRSARKQLDFDSLAYRRTASTGNMEDLYFSSDRARSPLKRLREQFALCTEEESREEETSRLLLQIVSVLRGKKRKSSDCCSCDDEYERECSKRRRKDNEFHSFSRQIENDSGYDSRITEKPDVIPDNCTCALMEKECLKMAETAYRNIRRQDGSAESFIQFRNELIETNSIISESLSMVKKIRQFCEHRFNSR